MGKPISAQDVLEMYPELKWITDEALREQCVNTYVTAYAAGGWDHDNATFLPVSLKRVETPAMNHQVDHVRAVTDLAVKMYDTLETKYHQQTNLRDIVIAGALLHDVGKLTEFSYQNGELGHSDNANIMRHPLSGAILAAHAGICEQVVHIIATHSFEGDKSYRSLAATIVKMADDASFQYILSFNPSNAND